MTAQLTLGPVLYNWPAEVWRDFYFQVADEAPVETVYLGEAICSKRAPLFDPYLEEVVTRLEGAGKKLVFSTLAEVTSNIDRKLIKRVATSDGLLIEANDTSALWFLEEKPHVIGPYMNVYNEDSLKHFAENGAEIICLPPEIPESGIAELGKLAAELGINLEIQVFGRVPLALSARCYHARAHDKTKDSCLFVCDKDPDGMVLETLEGKSFLTINGIQTQSYTCLNLANEVEKMMADGVSRFRISPQSTGTIAATKVFYELLDGQLSGEDANTRLQECGIDAPFSNGFFHQRPGFEWYSSSSPGSR